MRILIVGGGIAGLTLAALLRQRGIEPVVVEKAKQHGYIGYQLTLWPLGNRILHGLGLSKRFREISVPFERWLIHTPKGRRLRSFDAKRQISRHGEARSILRTDLLRLLQSFGDGIPIRMGSTITSLQQTADHVTVAFSDGIGGTFDLVVGADGIHSNVRRLLFGEQPLHQTGFTWWGWWDELGSAPIEEVSEFWAHDRLFGLYPSPGRMACGAVLPREAIPESLSDKKALIRTGFARFENDIVKRRCEALEHIDHIGIADLADLRIKHWGQGRVLLLGDSAAPFLPSAGVGASVAMESAAVLNDELSRTDAAHIPDAIGFYLMRRRERVDSIQATSRWLLKSMLPGNVILAAGRNWLAEHLSEDRFFEPLGRWMDRAA